MVPFIGLKEAEGFLEVSLQRNNDDDDDEIAF